MTWEERGVQSSTKWLSASERPAPKHVVLVDDRLTADRAIGFASQGTAMLWQGDIHGAKQILSAIGRRLTRQGAKTGKRGAAPATAAEQFYRIRQMHAQRSRVLSLILIPLELQGGVVSIPLPRAPEVDAAIRFAYGDLGLGEQDRAVVSLQELVGVLSAHQWYVNGVDVPSLGVRIHPHYGTFMPTRHEYVDLVASAPLPAHDLAFDIGTGTGVFSAVLAKRGIRRVIGTDLQKRAVDCATENFELLGIADVAEARICDIFPEGKASLIVCNPPWLPGSAATSLDAAIYDPGSQMLLSYPAGLPSHLSEGARVGLSSPTSQNSSGCGRGRCCLTRLPAPGSM
ncbi:class I SAM-dependent methyltransferase [Leucobacter sp. CX42]|uniref:class I SAM-dependent methyltransferase n=1 Tax=unclassified Leucobacter TaxID=2621730 RepID=UPI00333F3F7D